MKAIRDMNEIELRAAENAAWEAMKLCEQAVRVAEKEARDAHEKWREIYNVVGRLRPSA